MCLTTLRNSWDGVHISNAFRPHVSFSLGGNGPHNADWASVNARDDPGHNQDALPAGCTTCRTSSASSTISSRCAFRVLVDLHNAGVYGHMQNQPGLPYWLGWYRDFLKRRDPRQFGWA